MNSCTVENKINKHVLVKEKKCFLIRDFLWNKKKLFAITVNWLAIRESRITNWNPKIAAVLKYWCKVFATSLSSIAVFPSSTKELFVYWHLYLKEKAWQFSKKVYYLDLGPEQKIKSGGGAKFKGEAKILGVGGGGGGV